MNNDKLVNVGLGLGVVSLGILTCMSLSELAHEVRVHSLERKLYKQNIKLNKKLIDYVADYTTKHKVKKNK